MIFEKSITSKLIYKYRLFEVKNGDNFMEVDLLLFVTNFVNGNFSV